MNKSIKEAIKIIENCYQQTVFAYGYTPVYMFATENIRDVMKSIAVKEKSVLTVSSSGDHVFNMLVNGAIDVETYDINYFTKYYFYFKEAAIRVLDYNEFLDFFFLKKAGFNNKIFADEVFFNKILPSMRDEESKNFWAALFNSYGGKVLYNSNLFIHNSYPKNTYIEFNDYLRNEANYKLLQRRLNSYNYKFYSVNILDKINKTFDKKYDIIYLSNILDRLKCSNALSCAIRIKGIIERLKEYLNDNGLLGICYLYLYMEDYWENLSPNQINSRDFRSMYFNDNSYFYSSFSGVNLPNSSLPKNKDALMLLRKK